MPDNKKCRLGKQSAAMSSLRPCSYRSGREPMIEYSAVVTFSAVGQRAGRRADEVAPSLR